MGARTESLLPGGGMTHKLGGAMLICEVPEAFLHRNLSLTDCQNAEIPSSSVRPLDEASGVKETW